MLGTTLIDPEGLEGGPSPTSATGLGLLPIQTTFRPTKTTRQLIAMATWPESCSLEGFELHHGCTQLIEDAAADSVESLSASEPIGWVSQQHKGTVIGTYLHGLLDNGCWRRLWMNQLRQRKGLEELASLEVHHTAHRERLINRLADAFEAHIDIKPLLD